MLDHAAPSCLCYRFQPRMNAEVQQQHPDVIPNGVDGDVESRRDLRGGQTVVQEMENLHLARRQLTANSGRRHTFFMNSLRHS